MIHVSLCMIVPYIVLFSMSFSLYGDKWHAQKSRNIYSETSNPCKEITILLHYCLKNFGTLWANWDHVSITEWITVAKSMKSSKWSTFHMAKSHTRVTSLNKEMCVFFFFPRRRIDKKMSITLHIPHFLLFVKSLILKLNFSRKKWNIQKVD